MQNVKQTPMKCKVKHYYGPTSAPQICAMNANVSNIMSTVCLRGQKISYALLFQVNRLLTNEPLANQSGSSGNQVKINLDQSA